MKKLVLFAVLTGSLLSFNSCSDNEDENGDTTVANKVLVKWDGSPNGDEILDFEYNDKNQLTYFTESSNRAGVYVIGRTYRLHYNSENKLIELKKENLTGSVVTEDTIKYTYKTNYVIKTQRNTNPAINREDTLNLDAKGRLSKIFYGKLYDEYLYDANDNLIKINCAGTDVTQYEYDNMKSIFSNQKNLPVWFWVDHLDGIEGYAGKNNQTKIIDNGVPDYTLKYEYDKDGYPTKAMDATTNKVYVIYTYKIID